MAGAEDQSHAAPVLKTMQIVEVESGKKVAELTGVSHMVRDVAFSADGRLLAAALWDGAESTASDRRCSHSVRHAVSSGSRLLK
jgi:hypothetical protein